MKPSLSTFKNLIFSLLLILISNTLIAQTWPMPGAKWTYCLIGWNGRPAGEEMFGVAGDTLIAGNIYTITKPIVATKAPMNVENTSSRTLYTRYANDTVYRYVNNQEYMFFTFNLNVGDVFTTFRTGGWNYHWEDSACTSKLTLKVIEESEIELNEQTLKKFVLEDTLFHHLYVSNSPEPVTYVLVERIGIISSYPLINSMEPPGECSLPTDWGHGAVGRYTDDSFEHLFGECRGVGIDDIQKSENDINIYPNPANSVLNIDFPANFEVLHTWIYLIAIDGKTILQSIPASGSTQLDIKRLKPGVYIVKIQNDEALITRRITIR
ncbi:MAG: T9SS type A sorting domain-containing protein [Bacteroidales bacterium]|nr:T9SS type A sorting domain-containing protein [Bacteroidales bacterium]